MNKKILSELIKQINREFHSAYTYLGMSAYFERTDYAGSAHWMRIQAKEEVMHAMKLFTYLVGRGVKIELPEIKSVSVDYKSIHSVFELALNHEKELAEHLNDLSSLALKENDHTTYGLLQWYLNEQVEEINQASNLVGQLKLIDDEGEGLYMFDKHLAQRQEDQEAA